MIAQGKAYEPEDRFFEDVEFVLKYGLLNCLLKDRTTGKNIIWATGGADEKEEIRIGDVKKRIRPRWIKDKEARKQRTRSDAEVFTPSAICREMVKALEEAGFNPEEASLTSTCLEITCGEAPFIASRYDMETGDTIGVKERFGLLDKKLRRAGKDGQTLEEYKGLALSALKSVYGYEFQGDSLFLGRLNVLMDFVEHWKEEWRTEPDSGSLEEAAEAVSWNFWQMDGLSKDCLPPLKEPKAKRPEAIPIFAAAEGQRGELKDTSSPCVIKLWNEGLKGRKVEFRELFAGGKPLEYAGREKHKSTHLASAPGMTPLF